MFDAFLIKRRLNHLTLARQEWEEIVLALADYPETAEACRSAAETLRGRIAATPSEPDELLTISAPPLTWSPIILGLSAHVLSQPSLLPIAERLQHQLLAQSHHVEGRVSPVTPEQMARWPSVRLSNLERQISLN